MLRLQPPFILLWVLLAPAAAGAQARPAARAAGPVRFALAPDSNEARYRVREQLVGIDFPSDAVGRTHALTGQIVVRPDGTVLQDSSRFTVDLATLQSDRSGRDGYLRRNALQTDQYPTAVLVPTVLRGLPVPLPASGPVTFQLEGDFSVHGVTRPTTWDVSAQLGPGGISGTATTSFTFADFQIPVPRVRMVLSVRDTIRLEYDFRLVRGN